MTLAADIWRWHPEPAPSNSCGKLTSRSPRVPPVPQRWQQLVVSCATGHLPIIPLSLSLAAGLTHTHAPRAMDTISARRKSRGRPPGHRFSICGRIALIDARMRTRQRERARGTKREGGRERNLSPRARGHLACFSNIKCRGDYAGY